MDQQILIFCNLTNDPLRHHQRYREHSSTAALKQCDAWLTKDVIPAIQPDGPGTLLRFEVDEVLRAFRSPSEPSDAEAKTGSLATPSKRKQTPLAGGNEKKLSGPIPKWERTQNQSFREK